MTLQQREAIVEVVVVAVSLTADPHIEVNKPLKLSLEVARGTLDVVIAAKLVEVPRLAISSKSDARHRLVAIVIISDVQCIKVTGLLWYCEYLLYDLIACELLQTRQLLILLDKLSTALYDANQCLKSVGVLCVFKCYLT